MEDSRSNVYSTDSEFYYVDGKLKDISEFYKEMKYRGVRSIEPLFNATTNNNIDPIYEMIPKLSIEDNETEEYSDIPGGLFIARPGQVRGPDRPVFYPPHSSFLTRQGRRLPHPPGGGETQVKKTVFIPGYTGRRLPEVGN